MCLLINLIIDSERIKAIIYHIGAIILFRLKIEEAFLGSLLLDTLDDVNSTGQPQMRPLPRVHSQLDRVVQVLDLGLDFSLDVPHPLHRHRARRSVLELVDREHRLREHGTNRRGAGAKGAPR